MPTQQTSTDWAVVTGASSGLGALFAERLATRGLSLVLCGRDPERLKSVGDNIGRVAPAAAVEIVFADLATEAGVAELLGRLDGRLVEVLVNNAGFGTYGPFGDIDADRDAALIAVDVAALVRLTHGVLPGMVQRGRGGVLNVASTIAFQPAPYQATYGAAKAFVLSFSQALWGETRGSGVTVTALCPGPTRTGFVAALDSDVSHTSMYRRLAEPGPVVDAGLRGLERGRAVVVPGRRDRYMATGERFIPRQTVTRVTGRMLAPSPTA